MSTCPYLSQKRLNEIREGLVPILDNNIHNNTEKLEQIANLITTTLRFDPANTRKQQYTKEKGKASMAWRKKKAEELGVSEYAIHCKAYYERLKLKEKETSLKPDENI